MDLRLDLIGHLVMFTKIGRAYHDAHFWTSANELVPTNKYIFVVWLCQRWVITKIDRFLWSPGVLRKAIDVIHKWLPIHYYFVLVQISLPSLIVMG